MNAQTLQLLTENMVALQRNARARWDEIFTHPAGSKEETEATRLYDRASGKAQGFWYACLIVMDDDQIDALGQAVKQATPP